MSFVTLQKDIVGNFLHSAVLIDDQIEWLAEGTLEANMQLDEPDEFDNSLGQEEDGGASPNISTVQAKPIIKSFSKYGIVCAPYIWGETDTEFPDASEKADLLILDWKLESNESENEKGSFAKKFIINRLERDIQHKERLRFISIYTSEQGTAVADELLDELKKISRIKTHNEQNNIDITSRSGHKICRISIISKNTISEAQLAEKLIEEFANFVQGFLPNALLAAISEVRGKTYEFLAQYHSGLDLALISHFTSIKSQERTFSTAELQFKEYVANLISSSIQSSLAVSAEVKRTTSLPAMLKYIRTQKKLSMWANEKDCVDKQKIIKILQSTSHTELRDNAKAAFNLSGRAWDSFKEGKHPLFFNDSSYKSHLELSSLDLLKRVYTDNVNSPPLRLGSILKHKDHDIFYVCVQPLCDGVRLDTAEGKSHAFPFLRLEKKDTKPFDFVVPFEGAHIKLKCETKTRNIELFSFIAHKTHLDVRGQKKGKAVYPCFHSTSSDSFKWIGELKDIYAQELLNLLAYQASRVGSDKFEWLRIQT